MILGRDLTSAEMRSSQKNYMRYNLTNGFSYMCLGETVLILFAVKLHASDMIVAILGGMIYFGYLLLPLGKIMAGHSGAVKSQADFWVMRNISALIVALSAPVSLYLSSNIATCMLITGAFLFYGFRAAGLVMIQPLISEICSKERLGRFLSRAAIAFHITGLAALLSISLLMKINSGLWMLFSVIIIGTAMGITASTFIRKIHETGEIIEHAKKPIMPEIRQIIKSPTVRRYMAAGMFSNLAVIMLVPISMLMLKRGYGVSDTKALLYSLVQFGSSIFGAWIMSKVSDRIGARKIIIYSFYGNYIIALFWLFMPMHINCFLLIFPFIFCISGSVICSTALTQYFINSVPKKRQVAASMITAIAMGAVSGLAGMILSSSLLNSASFCNKTGNAIITYKYYFLFVLLLLPFMGFFIHKLAIEKEEKQKRKHTKPHPTL